MDVCSSVARSGLEVARANHSYRVYVKATMHYARQPGSLPIKIVPLFSPDAFNVYRLCLQNLQPQRGRGITCGLPSLPRRKGLQRKWSRGPAGLSSFLLLPPRLSPGGCLSYRDIQVDMLYNGAAICRAGVTLGGRSRFSLVRHAELLPALQA